MWIVAATFSAFFAGITAALSKCGIKRTNSNVATAIRTTVVLVFAWLMVFATGAYKNIKSISPKSWIFLILSGLATGASWICYFKALSLGEVSKVSVVDKSSVVLSGLFAFILFHEERNHLVFKLLCLLFIGVGTFLMTDIKKSDIDKKIRPTWLIFAFLSAIFAAATSILAKIGIENVDSNSATAIRTCVVFLLAWLIVIAKKEITEVQDVPKNDLLFLILSGISTGISWFCYYYAISKGLVSVVVPIDKLSILITVLFSLTVLGEHLSKKAIVGLALISIGTVAIAVIG